MELSKNINLEKPPVDDVMHLDISTKKNRDTKNFDKMPIEDLGEELVAIEDLDPKINNDEPGLESLAVIDAKINSGNNKDKYGNCTVKKSPLILIRRTVSSIDEADNTVKNSYFINLSEDCPYELEKTMHILYHANSDTKININISNVIYSDYSFCDLLAAITDSKANINLCISSIYRAIELLFMTANVSITCVVDQYVNRDDKFVISSDYAREVYSSSHKKHTEIIKASLIERGIISDVEADNIFNKGVTSVIPASKLNKTIQE